MTRFERDEGTPWSVTMGVGDGVGERRTIEEYTQLESEKDLEQTGGIERFQWRHKTLRNSIGGHFGVQAAAYTHVHCMYM